MGSPMHMAITLHCIAWESGATLLQDVRVATCACGLLSAEEMPVDEVDPLSRHALAVTRGGRAIGCARITPQGCIERIAVMPHEQREQVIAALIGELKEYARHAGMGKPHRLAPDGGIMPL